MTGLLDAVALTALWTAFCRRTFRDDPGSPFSVSDVASPDDDAALRRLFIRDLVGGTLPDAAVRRAFCDYLTPCEAVATSRPTPPYHVG